MATSSPLRNPPLRPDDWIEAAFVRLAREGIDSVRIEVLARDLGVSKGSFYWHFRDRDALLDQVLERWHKGETDWLQAQESHSADASPATRWARLVERSSEPGSMRAEIAIRTWARRSDRVATQLVEIEERKTCLVADVLRDIGFGGDAADSWAAIVLLVYQGWLDRVTRSGAALDSCKSLGVILSELVLAASTRP